MTDSRFSRKFGTNAWKVEPRSDDGVGEILASAIIRYVAIVGFVEYDLRWSNFGCKAMRDYRRSPSISSLDYMEKFLRTISFHFFFLSDRIRDNLSIRRQTIVIVPSKFD